MHFSSAQGIPSTKLGQGNPALVRGKQVKGGANEFNISNIDMPSAQAVFGDSSLSPYQKFKESLVNVLKG